MSGAGDVESSCPQQRRRPTVADIERASLAGQAFLAMCCCINRIEEHAQESAVHQSGALEIQQEYHRARRAVGFGCGEGEFGKAGLLDADVTGVIEVDPPVGRLMVADPRPQVCRQQRREPVAHRVDPRDEVVDDRVGCSSASRMPRACESRRRPPRSVAAARSPKPIPGPVWHTRCARRPRPRRTAGRCRRTHVCHLPRACHVPRFRRVCSPPATISYNGRDLTVVPTVALTVSSAPSLDPRVAGSRAGRRKGGYRCPRTSHQ